MRCDDTRVDGGVRPGRVGRRAAGAAAVLAVTAVLAAAVPAAAQPRPAEDVPADLEERMARHRGYPAVPASALGDDGRLSDVEASGARLSARMGGRDLSLVAGSPFVRLDDRVRQLPNPPYLEDGEIWVPVRLLRRAGVTASAGEPAAAPGRTGPWTVVLDPGHGGRDPGARGPRGVREKDVVLRIAQKTRDLLAEEEGIEASLTRDDDTFIPLDQRSHIAVERGADLFVSLHANAARGRSARGFETYYLGEARTEESRRVAMRENASVQYQEDRNWSPEEQVQYILTSADQRAYAQESNFVAGNIQNRLRRRHTGPDRGVKQAGFYVLMGATGSMPAVLVETGFISNPSGARLLSSEDGQARIARGIADAVAAYFEERERRATERTARR